ncbi:MAG: VOC family protein [Anaerolineales bacterium]
MKNAVNWFEIPAQDFDRAVQFYSTVLNGPVRKELFGGEPNGIFPYSQPGVGGAIVKRAGFEPTTTGAIVYLDAAGDLDGAVARVQQAGGKVLMPKTHIGDPGSIALILDSEGNRVALHSPN